MRRITRYLANIFYKPLLEKYLSKERQFTHNTIVLLISPQVFHPGFFFSTKLLLKEVMRLPLIGKKFLELGAGNGLISIDAAKAGAIVTATDINPEAIAYLLQNIATNDVEVTVIESDLFTMIPVQIFDIIAINPPYYLKTPVTFKEYAWYCGENGEYFHGLFASLSNYIDRNSVILMILCEGSDRELIGHIANSYDFKMSCISIRQNLIEKNYIFRVYPQ